MEMNLEFWLKKLSAIWKSLSFRGHCWMILSLPFSLRFCGGHNFLSMLKAESTGHEIVGGSSKAHRHFAGTHASMCCWWLKNKLTSALWQRRQEKSLSFARKNGNVPADYIYTEDSGELHRCFLHTFLSGCFPDNLCLNIKAIRNT